jgi:demethylmenaquinone methyltransferase/2-methoxy-6-polyprenyl-1,4-benzoquinol methylase
VSDEELLAEQRAFYRARAPEYDQWWQRTGRYDKGPELAAEWDRQVRVVEAALSGLDAGGSVLELAGGTGWWTERLARTADRLTVVDASPEVLELNRRRVQRADVEYLVADLFAWEPPRTYDVVFFSFWLSHVPRDRFAAFWSLVRSCLSQGGRAFFVDSREDPTPPAKVADPYVIRYGEDLHLRRLGDGSQYRVVKVMYEPDELQLLLEGEGWAAQVDATRWFVFGRAVPA